MKKQISWYCCPNYRVCLDRQPLVYGDCWGTKEEVEAGMKSCGHNKVKRMRKILKRRVAVKFRGESK